MTSFGQGAHLRFHMCAIEANSSDAFLRTSFLRGQRHMPCAPASPTQTQCLMPCAPVSLVPRPIRHTSALWPALCVSMPHAPSLRACVGLCACIGCRAQATVLFDTRRGPSKPSQTSDNIQFPKGPRVSVSCAPKLGCVRGIIGPASVQNKWTWVAVPSRRSS